MAEKKNMNILINILPQEMVEKILKLLKYKDLCQAQLICKRWNEIIGKIKTKVAGKILCLRPCHMFCLSLYECNYFILYSISFIEKISCIIVAGGCDATNGRGETSYSSAHSSHWAEPSFWAQLSSARQIQFLKKLSSAQLAKLNLPIQLGSAQLDKLNLSAQLILMSWKMSRRPSSFGS